MNRKERKLARKVEKHLRGLSKGIVQPIASRICFELTAVFSVHTECVCWETWEEGKPGLTPIVAVGHQPYPFHGAAKMGYRWEGKNGVKRARLCKYLADGLKSGRLHIKDCGMMYSLTVKPHKIKKIRFIKW